MGTSLRVMPFAGILGRVGHLCPRLLVNREAAGLHDQEDPPMFFGNIGLRLNDPENYRDVHLAADCDEGVHEICRLIGWTQELEALEASYSPGEDAFAGLVAAQRGAFQEEVPFGEDDRKLADHLFDAVASYARDKLENVTSSSGSAETVLSARDFDAAGQRLEKQGEELLVCFEESKGGNEHTESIRREEFCDMLQVPFRALGARTFRATAARQASVLLEVDAESVPARQEMEKATGAGPGARGTARSGSSSRRTAASTGIVASRRSTSKSRR
eukprot:gnl/TRDRNA2_/TRDRNA2_27655_c0_seq1.p1 gnl/TRDRNA2_/TRDRNA2_27655_c0~~gnl/TRDRNA2_/TRDRNA2_27655_c0_seq1.p1  ORF type:complete len:274 (+),score=62.20 gnl/TRDRNA2_/TRDRNA2_27655_c0_seq1:331-1152(+)